MDHLERHPDAGPAALASLRLVLLGGDWIPVGLPGRAAGAVAEADAQIISMGGATEVSMDSTIYEITRRPSRPGRASPTACRWRTRPPMCWARAARWMGRRRSAWPASWCSAASAWAAATSGRPELTAEKFVPDPFSTDRREPALPHRRPGALPARTAVLELLGRMDHQVKIRGFRIELGEIAGGAAAGIRRSARPWCWPARTSPGAEAPGGLPGAGGRARQPSTSRRSREFAARPAAGLHGARPPAW